MIIRELGGRCARCPRTDALQLDLVCAIPRSHHHLSFPDRTRFYFLQWRRGNVQLLCAQCHAVKTQGEARSRRTTNLIRVGKQNVSTAA